MSVEHKIEKVYATPYFHGYSIEVTEHLRNNYAVGYMVLLTDEASGHVLLRRFFADFTAARRAYEVFIKKESLIQNIQDAINAFFDHMAENRGK